MDERWREGHTVGRAMVHLVKADSLCPPLSFRALMPLTVLSGVATPAPLAPDGQECVPSPQKSPSYSFSLSLWKADGSWGDEETISPPSLAPTTQPGSQQ